MADRFRLTFHTEKRELSVYALSVAKGGPKLTAAEGDENAIPSINFYALGKMGAHNATMADFARSMQRNTLDRPVIDRSGLTGRYDFALTWVPDEFQFAGVRTPTGPQIPSNTDGVDLFTAMQQQLGLRLEATKGPTEVLVIDHAERPSAN
jgi:uncharacterized protein (TIGR03435 family)